jgi:Cytochrome c7 and related cytochrome c
MFTENIAKKRKAVRLVAFVVTGSVLLLMPYLVTIAGGAARAPGAAREAQVRRLQKRKPPSAGKPRVDYSRFSHSTHVAQQKLSCDSCHKFPTKNWKDVRKGDTAFADVAEFPEHSACLTCHRAQFFARERPAPLICSNCHVSVSPRDTSRFLFPSLGDVADSTKKRRDFISEFAVNFPHDKHLDVLAKSVQPSLDRGFRFVNATFQKEKPKEESDPKVCVMCHQSYQPQGDSADEYVTKPPKNIGDAFWLKKGTFKTIPVSHALCSTCHSTDGGIDPAPSKCEVCHKLLPAEQASLDFDAKLAITMGISDPLILDRWKRRESAGTFPHEGGAHPGEKCTACHNIPTMNTADPKTLKVAVKSCGGADGCHVTATSDEGGALNYEIDQRKAKADFKCTKCHLVFGTQAIPANHVEAIPKAVVK